MRRVPRCGHWLLSCVVVSATAVGLPPTASGGDDWGTAVVEGEQIDSPSAAAFPRFELTAGAQAFSYAWSLYSGVTVAPFSATDKDGLRLRASGGYGHYAYSGTRAVGVSSEIVTFKGVTQFGDVLIGYQKQLGPLTVKAFAGVAAAGYALSPDDPETAIRGRSIGGKVALEVWWTVSDRLWSSLDLSSAAVHDSYAARARLGWRFLPELSAGLEAGAAGNQESDVGRVGGFVRYEWSGGELSASSGWSSDRLLDGIQGRAMAHSGAPFVTFSWLTRF